MVRALQPVAQNSVELSPGRYKRIRATTLSLCADLQPEDTVVQSMPDVSPTKWHLAHTTWFFEHFVLEPNLPGYIRFDEQFHFLFNSYYYSVGQMHLRGKRGLLSRPTLQEVVSYRAHVDEAVDMLPVLLADGLNAAMKKLHTKKEKNEKED